MTKRRTTVVVGIAGVAAALALAGCSGSSSTGGDSTPDTNQTFSLGDGQVDTGGQLPAYWPSDVPTPEGLEYVGGANLSGTITGAFSGSTPVETVQTQLKAAFTAQGWTSSDSFGGGASGGIEGWKKGNQTTQVTVLVENGKTVASITVLNS